MLCMGVIEHIPHTPRLLLDTLTRVLKPGGILILDTPNLAYLYKRLALLDGGTIFCPMAQQYYTELPFEGHHREYIVDEIAWMLNAAGHEPISHGDVQLQLSRASGDRRTACGLSRRHGRGSKLAGSDLFGVAATVTDPLETFVAPFSARIREAVAEAQHQDAVVVPPAPELR